MLIRQTRIRAEVQSWLKCDWRWLISHCAVTAQSLSGYCSVTERLLIVTEMTSSASTGVGNKSKCSDWWATQVHYVSSKAADYVQCAPSIQWPLAGMRVSYFTTPEIHWKNILQFLLNGNTRNRDESLQLNAGAYTYYLNIADNGLHLSARPVTCPAPGPTSRAEVNISRPSSPQNFDKSKTTTNLTNTYQRSGIPLLVYAGRRSGSKITAIYVWGFAVQTGTNSW